MSTETTYTNIIIVSELGINSFIVKSLKRTRIDENELNS